MKKMAIAFRTFKKNLNKDYIKKGLTPDFEKDFKNNVLIGMHLCSTNRSRTANSEQHKPKRM